MMNTIWNKIKHQIGITYIELLVAIVLSSVVIIFIISANLFVNRFIQTWEKNNVIYEEGEYILSSFEKDLNKCTRLLHVDSATYNIITNNSDTITYLLSKGNISRNKKVINAADITCHGMNLTINQFENTTPGSILVSGKTIYLEKLVTVELQLEYSKLVETFESIVRLGNDSHIY